MKTKSANAKYKRNSSKQKINANKSATKFRIKPPNCNEDIRQRNEEEKEKIALND